MSDAENNKRSVANDTEIARKISNETNLSAFQATRLTNAIAAALAQARREGMEEAAGLIERRIEGIMENPDSGYVEGDTNAFVWTNCDAEWTTIQLGEAVDAIRRAAKEDDHAR